MKDQFEVWRCLFPEKGGEHPVVLISHPDICARAKVVNVLYCTSQRQGRRPYPNKDPPCGFWLDASLKFGD